MTHSSAGKNSEAFTISVIIFSVERIFCSVVLLSGNHRLDKSIEWVFADFLTFSNFLLLVAVIKNYRRILLLYPCGQSVLVVVPLGIVIISQKLFSLEIMFYQKSVSNSSYLMFSGSKSISMASV